jgi:signal transduction histidine kinase
VTLVFSWFERHPRLVDVAAALAAFLVFGIADGLRSGPTAVLINAIFALALAFRRRSPALALGIAWIGALIQLFTQPSLIVGDVMVVVVMFACGHAEDRRVRWAGFWSAIAGGAIAGVKLVLITNVLLPNNQSVSPNPVSRGLYLVAVSGVIAAALALFWALGVATRVRSAFELERVERLESEKERLGAELRVAQQTERNHITREMHDAIGHSLTVMIAQSDGARYALATDPEAANKALEIINRSARSALDDVNSLLSVLSGDENRAGAPGLANVPELLAEMEASGLTVRLIERGVSRSLAKTQDLAAYRVLQETLTNALKHGGDGTAVEIELEWQHDALELETKTVETEQPVYVRAGHAGARVGHGIAGMVERVRLIGGALEAGIRNDGATGFRVHARIPYRSRESE